MTHTIVMPDLGQTTTEGKILKWLKQPGEMISRGDHLIEVETDKVTMEVESYVSGYLREALAAEGELVSAMSPIALVTDTAEEPVALTGAKPSVSTPATEPVVATPRTAPPSPGGMSVAPAARALARELGLDLTLVSGTGPGGLITRKDVEAFTQRMEKPRSA
jgi:pyruvate/2-oxoglutarate dehydrogenase complex dihydrolipoamide acyltransferase (E2) component